MPVGTIGALTLSDDFPAGQGRLVELVQSVDGHFPVDTGCIVSSGLLMDRARKLLPRMIRLAVKGTADGLEMTTYRQ